jgi:hypothetical protein
MHFDREGALVSILMNLNKRELLPQSEDLSGSEKDRFLVQAGSHISVDALDDAFHSGAPRYPIVHPRPACCNQHSIHRQPAVRWHCNSNRPEGTVVSILISTFSLCP